MWLLPAFDYALCHMIDVCSSGVHNFSHRALKSARARCKCRTRKKTTKVGLLTRSVGDGFGDLADQGSPAALCRAPFSTVGIDLGTCPLIGARYPLTSLLSVPIPEKVLCPMFVPRLQRCPRTMSTSLQLDYIKCSAQPYTRLRIIFGDTYNASGGIAHAPSRSRVHSPAHREGSQYTRVMYWGSGPSETCPTVLRSSFARDPRENPPANGIGRHDSHLRNSGVTRPGIEPDPRGNRATSGIVRHDSHMRISGADPAENRTRHVHAIVTRGECCDIFSLRVAADSFPVPVSPSNSLRPERLWLSARLQGNAWVRKPTHTHRKSLISTGFHRDEFAATVCLVRFRRQQNSIAWADGSPASQMSTAAPKCARQHLYFQGMHSECGSNIRYLGTRTKKAMERFQGEQILYFNFVTNITIGLTVAYELFTVHDHNASVTFSWHRARAKCGSGPAATDRGSGVDENFRAAHQQEHLASQDLDDRCYDEIVFEEYRHKYYCDSIIKSLCEEISVRLPLQGALGRIVSWMKQIRFLSNYPPPDKELVLEQVHCSTGYLPVMGMLEKAYHKSREFSKPLTAAASQTQLEWLRKLHVSPTKVRPRRDLKILSGASLGRHDVN
ncbi:hypothetical protein PR048_031610 [Dryococelus australis]|uniref:Uncharacterized protein n=1 Tax=Dryococelus australis TaxID=614101 RepID=A0ABQ9G5T1_9NEOP|nr:hypothetical protein PR048_031610 [Dryococelus australis]